MKLIKINPTGDFVRVCVPGSIYGKHTPENSLKIILKTNTSKVETLWDGVRLQETNIMSFIILEVDHAPT